MREENPQRTTTQANVKDLQEKGFLPEITEEWVAKQLGEDYQKLTSISDADAWNVVIQKLTNQLTMLLDAAEQGRRENTFVRDFSSGPKADEKASFVKMIHALDVLDAHEKRNGPVVWRTDENGKQILLKTQLLERWVHHLRNPEDVDRRIQSIPFVDDVAEIITRLEGKPDVDVVAWRSTDPERLMVGSVFRHAAPRSRIDRNYRAMWIPIGDPDQAFPIRPNRRLAMAALSRLGHLRNRAQRHYLVAKLRPAVSWHVTEVRSKRNLKLLNRINSSRAAGAPQGARPPRCADGSR